MKQNISTQHYFKLNILSHFLLELQFANKYLKKLETVPFIIYSPWESTEIKYPPFGRTLHCANAKEAQSAKAEFPFLVYYSLKSGDKDADLFRAIDRDNRLQASGVIVINSTATLILSPSFFQNRKEAKKFPLPLIVVSSSCYHFLQYLEGNKGKVTLFQKEGSKNHDSFIVYKLLKTINSSPVELELIYFSLFVLMLCHCMSVKHDKPMCLDYLITRLKKYYNVCTLNSGNCILCPYTVYLLIL